MMPSLWRRAWYQVPGRQHRLDRPVISVGNLATGGRGKTPVVEALARLLLEAGQHPAILSRGYGRRVVRPGAVVVSDGARILADVDRSGDEPLMLARALPGVAVVVCDDRRLAGALAERALGATVHLLDDGFQHLQLARDIDLVMVEPDDLSARTVPFGPLREAPAALRAADAVLSEADLPPALPLRPDARRFRIQRRIRMSGTAGPEGPASRAGVEAAFVALCAIARPERFLAALDAQGVTIARAVTFRDHHRFTARDLARVTAAVAETGAAGVITTAKDAVRLPDPPPWPLTAATVEASILPPAAFRTWLFDRLGEGVSEGGR